MKKIIKVCVLLLIGVLCLLSGKGCVSVGNSALMAIHCVLTAVFFYLIPVAIFKRGDYRLVGFVLEITLGFMLFLWLYLDVVPEIKSLYDIGWTELLMFDGAVLAATGFGGAMVYCKSVQN
ncbi:MAG: hypothetical protein IJ532_08420 [Alphaproteobacteria bacterium]|nr:hypothetical protein [Alphaproteobacteria bacterium]